MHLSMDNEDSNLKLLIMKKIDLDKFGKLDEEKRLEKLKEDRARHSYPQFHRVRGKSV